MVLNPRAIAACFDLPSTVDDVAPHPVGHINDSFIVRCSAKRFLLQRINHHVFKNPVAVMENIARVTAHLCAKGMPTLTLVPARDGNLFHRDDAGNYWRLFDFIEGARTVEVVETPDQAHEAARAFGEFQSALSDLAPSSLHETIPDFHNTPKRFAAFESALKSDRMNRAAAAKKEVEFALARKSMTSVLLDLELPVRVTHNDTKVNNVLLHSKTGRAVCIVDLDTVMPGLALYDFGDLVRTATSPAAEDERDLSKVKFQKPMYDALERGYLESAGAMLTAVEKSHLVFSGKLITFEIGLRFLTDFLDGDTYFKTHREGHNLDRCRTQFKLVEELERKL